MKWAEINQNREWRFVLPDSIADWDAITGWEKERLASMQSLLEPGMLLFDIGTEHGWLSALYGSWVGHENIVLVEPTREMWVNIRKIWEANELPTPKGRVPMFCGRTHDVGSSPRNVHSQWPVAVPAGTPEVGGMPYTYLDNQDPTSATRTATLDLLTVWFGPPQAITIDIEGYELDALQGGLGTLADHHPIVWVSIHPDLMERRGQDPKDLIDLMKRLGYRPRYLGNDHEEHWLFTWVC